MHPKRDQEVAQVFKHEIIRLDVSAVARQVRESGRLSLITQSRRFDLNLIPHDLRAPNYRAEEVTAGGLVHPIEIGSVRTYKGRVLGMDRAQARFTISNEMIEGVILTKTGSYYLEPAKRFSASADVSDFILHKASDVPDISTLECDVTKEDKPVELRERGIADSGTSVFDGRPLGRVVEIATEADFEYVNSLGGSQQANNEILSTLNVVEGIYEEELGLTFQVTFQHTWATVDDPYTTTDSGSQLLNEFRDHWNLNFQTINRDVAHLWTSKPAGGIAFVGTVCRTNAAYGLSSGSIASTPTHEFGHNFGALHPDQQTPPVTECAGTIMQSIQARDLTFCPFSRSQIAAYVTASGSCLAASPQSCATLTLSASDISFGPNAGSSAFKVDSVLGCSWTARSDVDWITITSGGAGNGSGVVNYSVSPNSGSSIRVGTIAVGSRTLTISQDSVSCAPIPPPLSWWRAEGNVNDSVGPNHGKLFGTATYANGLVGRGFKFNNVTIFDDYLYAPTSRLPRGNSDMTVEFWFNEGATGSELTVWFEQYIGGSTRARYEVIMSRFRVLFRGDLTSLSGNFESSDPLQWHHVAVTNQGNTCILYLDGKITASGNVQIDLPQSTAFYIGQGQKGFVDEVSVYNRALTQSEIQAIFLAGNAGKCGATNPTTRPTLLTEGNTTRAIAVDSVTFIRDPLPFSSMLNLSSDSRTRVMLFASNLELLPGETGSVVAVQAEDLQHRIYPLTVEYVGKVPNLDWLTQINVRLPDGLANGGDVLVSFNLRGTLSNKALLSVR